MADINLTAEQVAALILSIGDKSKLKTEEKQTLVDAINNVLDMRVNPERLSDLMRQFEAQLSNIYDSDIPAVPYVDNFTKLPIQTLAVERTAQEQNEADGQEINVLGLQETFAGVAKDIDADGALLVETPGGLRRVLAGDVSFRPRK